MTKHEDGLPSKHTGRLMVHKVEKFSSKLQNFSMSSIYKKSQYSMTYQDDSGSSMQLSQNWPNDRQSWLAIADIHTSAQNWCKTPIDPNSYKFVQIKLTQKRTIQVKRTKTTQVNPKPTLITWVIRKSSVSLNSMCIKYVNLLGNVDTCLQIRIMLHWKCNS